MLCNLAWAGQGSGFLRRCYCPCASCRESARADVRSGKLLAARRPTTSGSMERYHCQDSTKSTRRSCAQHFSWWQVARGFSLP